MHTEGNLFVTGRFTGYMVSSPNSCLYKEEASRITTREIERPTTPEDPPKFQGQYIAGSVRDNSHDPDSETRTNGKFHLWAGDGQEPIQDDRTILSKTADSVIDGRPVDFALDPVVLQTADRSISRAIASGDPRDQQAGTWNGSFLQERRLQNEPVSQPYVDDTFRADNRWGPKPRWGENREDISLKVGDKIAEGDSNYPILVGSDPPPGESDSNVFGLDGYWERRARFEGLRLIVGQRLELGDPAGWGGPATGNSINERILGDNASKKEPLRPWENGCTGDRCNETRQRKNMWDNLAAIQATAVYHGSSGSRDYPVACLATTVHPGTAATLDKSATFENLALGFDTAIAGYPSGSIISDFFRGRGTNAWEFSIPPRLEDDFTNPSSDLFKALSNLAYFTGDPDGGAPSFPPVQDETVHPHPSMTMWGDFSVLRQVLAKVMGNERLSPADLTTLHTSGCMLSMLAYNLDYLEKLDYSLIQSRHPELIGYANESAPTPDETNDRYWQGLRGHIRALDAWFLDGSLSPIPASTLVPTDLKIPTEVRSLTFGEDMNNLVWDKKKNNDPETYVRLLEQWRDSLANSDPDPTNPSRSLKAQLTQEIHLAQLIITKEQVARDRLWGFEGEYKGDGNRFSYAPLGSCNKWGYEENTKGSVISEEPLTRLCSTRPRYPILYSLFPAKLPDSLTRNPDAVKNKPTTPGAVDAAYLGGVEGFLPEHFDIIDDTETRVRDSEDIEPPWANHILDRNTDARYQLVRPADIAARPLSLDPLSLGGLGTERPWTLPFESTTNGSTPNNFKFNYIKVCPNNAIDANNTLLSACSRATSRTDRLPIRGRLYRIPFKDAAFYNGRELLSVRTLDIDLDLLRRSSAYTGDYWLPKTGIVYAFREDAVSEAHIVRPKQADWEDCNTELEIRTTGCQMKTANERAIDSYDPPLNSENDITPKPVDYFPDPDRRPNGFRLRQGAALWRGAFTDDTNTKDRQGISFVTDNPAYIQGAFNLHRPPGSTAEIRLPNNSNGEFLEEFEGTDGRLRDNFSNFYDRTLDDLDVTFSSATGDQWRSAEIVADAVTLLSPNFCDGSIQDAFVAGFNRDLPTTWGTPNDRYGCINSGNKTSYLNGNLPILTPSLQVRGAVRWVRSNLIDSLWKAEVTSSDLLEGESPIVVARTGHPLILRGNPGSLQTVEFSGPGSVNGTYAARNTRINQRKSIEAENGIQMNMIMVSGITPSREGQPYGGLQNFPRFIEFWRNKRLYISGAFLQLNFSTYATAPFDQEGWEPGAPVPTPGIGTNEWIPYYEPPTRFWGFDVGLKYAPPGPVAERFRSPDSTRSEFYSEPPADDPYIENLARCANDPDRCSP
ncbi:MAG: hypothetical protein HC769_09730 [Cyanobacteria bacterium CRU_2_1]|nr:hypothetical protein [Cyanobacteria bacterium CRU_2_1]